MKNLSPVLMLSIGGGIILTACQPKEKNATRRPNILIAISDDQSFAHTSFAGSKFVNTPAFDRVAKNGIYFANCFSGSPGSAPSRGSLVTGRYHWQNEQSGQHASSWMKKFVPFVDVLEASGYHAGFTGKGVDPFQYARNEQDSLWRRGNAAGDAYNSIRYKTGDSSDDRPAGGIGAVNYSANFRDFMQKRQKGQPFCFWYGASEPHRTFEKDSWKKNGKNLADAEVPGFLPDDDVIKGDLLDYAVEIEWFDHHLDRILNYLDSIGELENTIVIVTGDNGMSFPRAKALGYEYGLHVPLAISYPKEFPANRIVNDPVSFVDIAPTILEMTNTESGEMLPISGKSITGILRSKKGGIVDRTKRFVFAGRERHSSARWNNLGYPQRAIRSEQYLLIWSMRPDLWPAGDPQALNRPMYGIDEKGIHHSEWAFADVDASPSKSFLIENYKDEKIRYFFEEAYARNDEFELYDIKKDPYCLTNLSGNPGFTTVEKEMKKELVNELTKSEDPRIVGPDREIFETYIRYSPIREFPKPDGLK